MPTPGLLTRLAEPSPGPHSPAILASLDLIPGAIAVYRTSAKDDKTPSINTLYFLADIEPILGDSSPYERDLKSNSDTLTSLSWVVLSFINGRDRVEPALTDASNVTGRTSDPLLPSTPQESSVIVLNGTTPRDDKEIDYHSRYDTEHGEKLANVPGWQAMRRYKLEMVYGKCQTAKFYGMNVYDEENGLGGKEWQDGVTEWTLRIREQAARPNIRRIWKVDTAVS